MKNKTNNLNLSKTQCQSNIPICMANVAKKQNSPEEEIRVAIKCNFEAKNGKYAHSNFCGIVNIWN